MPRIRTVKPEFWTDPVMVQLTPLARLFYIGTWNFAMCDQGHLEDDPMRLKLQILPAENVDVSDLIDALVGSGRLARIEVNGEPFLHIKNLAEHQKVDGRWTPRCPACAHQASPKLTETHRASPKHTAVREGKGKESKGKDTAAAAAEPETFAAWWDDYPKKIGKGQAVKAYKAALKKADADMILAGLRRHLPLWERTERQFIPNPSTWLNGERWDDEVDHGEDVVNAHLPSVAQLVAERGW